MDGVFITATDTGVGKTTVSAGLLKLLFGSRPVAYWKPVQTGTVIGDDTHDVMALTELDDGCFIEPAYRFAEPIAPYLAARHFKKSIEVKKLVEIYRSQQEQDRFIIVEGAGGPLVPLNEDALLLDLVQQLKLPVIVVSPDKLGTINQTLLTVNALRDRGIPTLGVVMTMANLESHNKGNAECIHHYGDVEILASFREHTDRKTLVSNVSCDSRLRQLFDVPEIPQ